MSPSTYLVALLVPVIGLIAIAPEPIAFHLGPLPVLWYGVCYAAGLAVSYAVITREARRRGLNARLVDNGIIVVAVAALAGGRLYHVIDQWQLYQDNLVAIVLPPYNGLGVYGGIFTGTLAAYLLIRLWRQSFWKWADVVAPGLFAMQAIGRWGNFFNQELYGPPTNLPWGVAIECANRTATWACPPLGDTAVDAHFQPLFLYESVSGAVGAVLLLFLARRVRALRPGDLALIFFAWYGTTRFLLETLRSNNWTFFDVPVASIISATFVAAALAALAWRHRPGAAAPGDGDGPPAPVPEPAPAPVPEPASDAPA
jgi:phosphatidylglycerol:prolipoprotein diacylglycerol transferase